MDSFRTATAPLFRKPRRISITVAHHTFCVMQERSDLEGRSLSNLAAYLLEQSLAPQRGSSSMQTPGLASEHRGAAQRLNRSTLGIDVFGELQQRSSRQGQG